jgi:hypothetical protein
MSAIFFTFEGENYVSKSLKKSNHRIPRTNKVDTYEAPVLHIIKETLFYQPKGLLTPMSILCV